MAKRTPSEEVPPPTALAEYGPTATPDCRYIDLANGSLRRAAEVVGDKWIMMIVRDAMIGVTRFDELRVRLGCSAPVLSNRLRRLVREGILESVPYREPGQRTRTEYRLTGKGAALFQALAAIMQWGDAWLADAAGAALRVRHTGCGCVAQLGAHCQRDGSVIGVGQLYIAPGPNARFVGGPRRADVNPGPGSDHHAVQAKGAQ